MSTTKEKLATVTGAVAAAVILWIGLTILSAAVVALVTVPTAFIIGSPFPTEAFIKSIAACSILIGLHVSFCTIWLAAKGELHDA